ncbi:MAG TPA: hypothetical protein ENH00_09575 [Actinobacteria bacterium]|nr:hypothetical protein BMS3Bbin01_00260 [bacterium BMS3Bbin01]HDH26427.1 hypothetical protein [Actinomycetota bacterium]
MVRTGARANALKGAMIDAGFATADNNPAAPRVESLPRCLAADVMHLYATLGGRDPAPHFRPGTWDLAFEGELLVELDEQLHFNRYRATTLHEDWAMPLPWRDGYLRFCDEREAECLADGRWGKRWSNRSCEVMFGRGDEPGILAGGGSPRWKQRAFYDAVKDAFALTTRSYRVARLSIYDRIGDIELGEALSLGIGLDPEALTSFIWKRSASAPS